MADSERSLSMPDRCVMALLPISLLVLVLSSLISSPVSARSVSDVLEEIGEAAEARLREDFQNAGVAWPPASISLLAIKDRNTLELWATETPDGPARLIRTDRILAASGVAGPKLQEGDFQVPEGEYRIIGLNPNSRYHLSMKLDYPNAFDRQQARADGRTHPGSNIFIHGRAVSAGCLAMGDRVIEDLFTLVARVGRDRVRVLIAPTDPRHSALAPDADMPVWTSQLYARLTERFSEYPVKSGASMPPGSRQDRH